MRFGLEITSYVKNAERAALTSRCLSSLINTNLEGLEKPVLYITYKPVIPAVFNYNHYFHQLQEKYELVVRNDPPGMDHAYKVYLDAATKLLNEYPSVTHLTFMWDDFVYNSEWLQELYKIILRHPDAVAWSIYRSRFTQYHRIIGGDGVDVLMSMHDGIGTVTRQEWGEYCKVHGPNNWWEGPDIDHSITRPGNRWATSKDYCQNLSPHSGIETVDCAIEFVGE